MSRRLPRFRLAQHVSCKGMTELPSSVAGARIATFAALRVLPGSILATEPARSSFYAPVSATSALFTSLSSSDGITRRILRLPSGVVNGCARSHSSLYAGSAAHVCRRVRYCSSGILAASMPRNRSAFENDSRYFFVPSFPAYCKTKKKAYNKNGRCPQKKKKY